MKIMQIAGMVVLALASVAAQAKSITLSTPSGYEARAEVHDAMGKVKGVVIMLHGKNGNPGASQYDGFYLTLQKGGYLVGIQCHGLGIFKGIEVDQVDRRGKDQ